MKSHKFRFPTLSLVVFVVFAFSATAIAKVEVLFHPHDPTLEKIATWIREAQQHVDIAMYNMDTTDGSPVIKMLKSDSIRTRIERKELQIRILFEGFGTDDENAAKMKALEDLGIDARYLGRSVKVHHKFAAIDTGLENERVISGSANWSLGSYRNYNENILFIDGEEEASDRFQAEFNLLWANSKPFGKDLQLPEREAKFRDQAELEIHFNTLRRLQIDKNHPLLTDQIVRAIESAKSTIDIASTRVRLVPILEAISAAADRGVQIRIVIGQDDYRDLSNRAIYLNKLGIQLRVKFYNLKPGEFITHQMHNKFLIIDGESVMTGSFNWSESAEKNHIENIVEFRGALGKSMATVFTTEFESIWEMGRENLTSLKVRLANMKKIGQTPKCAFAPTTMELPEIRSLLRAHRKCELQQAMGRLQIDLNKLDFSRRITEKIVAFEVDIGFIVNPFKHPDLVFKKIGDDKVTFQRKRGATKIPKRIFADGHREQVEQLLGSTYKNYFKDWKIVDSTSLEVVRMMVAEGLGVGVIPERVAMPDRYELEIYNKSLPIRPDEIFLAYRKEVMSSRAAKELIGLASHKL